MKLVACLAAMLLSGTGFAQDMPIPQLLKGLEQKARWQMEVLEASGRSGKGMSITVCTSLADEAKKRQRSGSGCKHRLVKDTADEALLESECDERKSTISMKRDGKSMLMDIQATGPKGPQSAKLRYTNLGACREENPGRSPN